MIWETGLIQQPEHPDVEVILENPPGGGPIPLRPHLLSQVIRLPAEGKPSAFISETMEP